MQHKNFDSETYWSSRPFCIICKKRKVVTGNICHQCKQEGLWPDKYLNPEEAEKLASNSENSVKKEEEYEKQSASPFLKDLIGYFHDCAQELLHTLPLVNVMSKDILFLPLPADGLQKMISEGIRFEQKEGFTIFTELQQVDRELIFGLLFLQGEKTRIKDKKLEINAPLLYVRAELKRIDDQFLIAINDDTVSLNQTVLTQLLDTVPEEEIEIRLQELYQMIPAWPIDNESIQKFVSTLETVFPDIVSEFPTDLLPQEWENKKYPNGERGLQISSALIVAKKPEFDGTVVSELLRLQSDAKAGTTLDSMFLGTSEIENSEGNIMGEPSPEETSNSWVNVFPLTLSDSQQQIILGARESRLSVISGPPGTGKTYTIAAIVIDHILAGKKVLVASRMDKAIEVIARFLENAIDPNSIARSGGREQQRALANKIEKITTSPLKPSAQNLDSLINQYKDLSIKISDFVQQYEDTLRDERQWATSSERIETLEKRVNTLISQITKSYSTPKAESLLNKLKQAEKILNNKSFFLQTWWGKTMLKQIRSELNVPDETSISQLSTILESLKEKSIKISLQDKLEQLDDVNTIWHSLLKLREYQTDLAKKIIQETISTHVTQVIHDHDSRKQLRDFLRSLQLANPRQKLALLKEVSPMTLLETFGCWASTTAQISQILPLEPDLFDLVIFDESSQCDIASAIPALYRAKRAIIVGDPKQLHHVVFIGKQAEFASFATHNIDPASQVKYRFSQKSLFDVAIDSVEQQYNYFLDEHYRSKPAIISFPNDKFYGGNLRIMTQRPSTSHDKPVIKVEYVDGVRTIGSVNEKEIEKIFADIREIIDNDSINHPTSIGIVSPFRDQVNAIQKAALKYITMDEYERHKIGIGTAHTFQGDEKDLIILSLSIDHAALARSLRFLETENVFNVAITRARERLIVISSLRPKDIRMGLLKEYLEYIEGGTFNENPSDKFDSKFEQDVAEELRTQGLNVWTQYPSANFIIDLVVSDGKNSVAVECDGPYHNESQSQIIRDAERQKILERAGWQFVRIPSRLWYQQKNEIVEEIIALLNQNG